MEIANDFEEDIGRDVVDGVLWGTGLGVVPGKRRRDDGHGGLSDALCEYCC